MRGGPRGQCPDDDPRTHRDGSADDEPRAHAERSAGGRAASKELSNELSGIVHGSAVQAGSIHGDVHFSITQAGPTGMAAYDGPTRTGAYSGPAGMPVPAQLPPAAAHFTGRAEELASLDRAAAEYDPARRVALAVIVGAGGVGKTSLASYWLHRVSHCYEGGQLYADLRGQAPDAAARPGKVLTGFLSALGMPPERIPLGLDEQAKLYRSVTSGRRMLVLLDNAASAAQVRALLPGPGPRGESAVPGRQELPTLVVVTSRWRITGLAMDGARFVELGPLDESSGLELLVRMVGAERASAEADAARSVVRLCGGLPLAVCVAGARLVSHVRWPIGRVAAELADEQRRLAVLSVGEDLPVRAVFDVACRALPAGPARLYRLLSLVPGPDFSAELAAAVSAVSLENVTGLLDALTGASLLEETGEQRFQFHDLVKLHARERAQAEPPRERRAAITRAIGWYLVQAVAADIVIIPGRWRLNPLYERARAAPPGYDGPSQALEWMEAELPGLLAAVRAAHDEGLHEHAWQLCEAMWGLFAYRKYFRHWIDAHVLGLASAQACGDTRAEARMLVQLGIAYLNLGRHGEAREEFARALTLARREGHRIGEATALEQVGLADLNLGGTDEAIAAFAEARDIFRQIGVPRGILGMTRHIGEAHRDAGRHEQAVRHLLEARRLSAALPDRYNEGRCLISLGQAYLKSGQPDAAARSLGEALDIMASLGGSYEQARIRALLAEALLRLGRADQARDHLARALDVYSGVGSPEADDVRRRLSELQPQGNAAADGRSS